MLSGDKRAGATAFERSRRGDGSQSRRESEHSDLRRGSERMSRSDVAPAPRPRGDDDFSQLSPLAPRIVLTEHSRSAGAAVSPPSHVMVQVLVTAAVVILLVPAVGAM
jgi:hypothetical protein